MTSNYHTPIANGAAANATTFNSPLSSLDTQVTANVAAIAVNAAAIAASSFDPSSIVPQARLSLSSTLAVTVADVTAATTLYLHPFRGKYVPIYDGSDWQFRALSAAVSVAIPATTSTVYDVFAYWNTSVIALELVAWSSGTARATALTTQDGINVKSGDATRRYMGTIRTTTVSGQCEVSISKCFVWNAYNRLPRFLNVIDTTDSWSYATATWRQARAQATNQVELVVGLAEDLVKSTVIASGFTGSGAYLAVGVGVNSTSTNSAQIRGIYSNNTGLTSLSSSYKGVMAVGYTYLAWLEIGGASGTFYGDQGNVYGQSGLDAEIWA